MIGLLLSCDIIILLSGAKTFVSKGKEILQLNGTKCSITLIKLVLVLLQTTGYATYLWCSGIVKSSILLLLFEKKEPLRR